VGAHPWFEGDPIVTDQASTTVGEAGPFAGHGTFVAGLIRQYAPGARIVSHQAMSQHGVFWEGAVVESLQLLLDQVDAGDRLDVVCLAFGYYNARPGADPHTRDLARLLGELGARRVQVVVAAGNDSTDSPTFPAALAQLCDPASLPTLPLVSVGAENPDGSPASYTNTGEWVTAKEVGTAVVSTIPVGFGAADAKAAPTDYDPDNLVSGFARWGGTSFAAAIHAGKLADEIARAEGGGRP